MTLQLRLSSLREKHPHFKGNARTLLRFSLAPDPPSTSGTKCDAFDSDGRPCDVVLSSAGNDPWCNRHLKEWKDLSIKWNKTQKDAEKLLVTGLDVAKQKVMKIRLSIDLRRQIRDRFYARGGDIQDYIKWIAKLETDLRQLADTLLMENLNRGPTPETPGIHTGTPHPDKAELGESIMILQSPLDPKIPMESLQGLPDDGTILILKHFYVDLCNEIIRRLYKIVPDLDDSPKRSKSPNSADTAHDDHGTDIVRAWFRIMVLNDSEASVLEHATRSRTIDSFLSGCHASQIEMYCDFFEKAWRPHAAQYLRAAICAQTLAGGDIKTIQLLGGTIPSTTEGLRMTKPCWDILYRWFPTLLTPWTLASICSNFEEYTTVCKLLMLKLYNDHWFDPTSIMTECSTGVYLGFIPTSKGESTSLPGPKQEGKLWVERQSRNYLCGQMAIGHALTQAFLDELRKRIASLYLVVYEGTHADATVHPTEPDLFISRHRSALSREELDRADFSTTLTLEDIKNQLRMRKTSMYDPIVVDSWQFIIIDREVGLPFKLMEIVQDTLLMLVSDPSPRSIAKRVIREVIPGSVQEIYLEEIQIESSMDMRYAAPPEIQYEGNRFRCHDPDRSIVLAEQAKLVSANIHRDTNRTIRRIVEDMERCGIITLATEYEKPQTYPVIVQGSDGAADLYFPYHNRTATSESGHAPLIPLPSKSCLLDFARAFKEKNPNAVIARGSIQTHYCAWPMPAIKSLGNSGSNFATWEGHLYQWNAMPFDRPSSANAWQYYIRHFLNSKYPFLMFYLTTFVICATDAEDAEKKAAILLEEMEDRGWRVNLAQTQDWTGDVGSLNLTKLFSGVRPA